MVQLVVDSHLSSSKIIPMETKTEIKVSACSHCGGQSKLSEDTDGIFTVACIDRACGARGPGYIAARTAVERWASPPQWAINEAISRLVSVAEAAKSYIDGSPDRGEIADLANRVSVYADLAINLLRRTS